jgi:hypothetical protein
LKTHQENESRCARCGAAFVCGMTAGRDRCWCADLPPLEPVRGRGCLCRRCLVKELGKNPTQQSS